MARYFISSYMTAQYLIEISIYTIFADLFTYSQHPLKLKFQVSDSLSLAEEITLHVLQLRLSVAQ